MKRIKIKRLRKDQILFTNNNDQIVTINFINRYNQQGSFNIAPNGYYQLHFTKIVTLYIPDDRGTRVKVFKNNGKTSKEMRQEVILDALDIAVDTGEFIMDIADGTGGILGILGDILEFIGDIFD